MKLARMRARSRQETGFTLVELLVTIGIIALLASLLLPSLARVKAHARTISCLNNLRQMGIATEMYSVDNSDKLPGCQHSLPKWAYGLRSYCGTNVYLCPQDQLRLIRPPADFPLYSVVINDFLTPHPHGARTLDYSIRNSIPSPSETLLFGEAADDYSGYDHFHFADSAEHGYTPDRFILQAAAQRHGRGANYLFAEGHVETMLWESKVKPLLTMPGSRFVHPQGRSAFEYLAGE